MNINAIINSYLTKVRVHGIEFTEEFETPTGTVALTCIGLQPGHPVPGFVNCTSDWQKQNLGMEEVDYQYDLRTQRLGRPKAFRVPFLNSPEFGNKKFGVSHLCHKPWCLNPRHHVLESLEDNKGRNGCPGGNLCRHVIRCLIPGPYHRGITGIVPFGQLHVFPQ